jgi:DNA-binding transcriptional LysR family regulator
VREEAPQVRLRFVQKLDKDSGPLRDGIVDLETGVVGEQTGPEVRTRVLFRDRFVGVVRMENALSRGEMTAARYASGQHVLVSRRSMDRGPLDDALKPLGLEREIVTFVGGFSGALAFARATDLIATVPEKHTGNLRSGMFSFKLPVPSPELTISMLWHPRMDADMAQRWLRGCLLEVCTLQIKACD